MPVDPESIVRRYWAQVWSAGSVAAVAELYEPGWRENGKERDVTEFQQAVAGWFTKFPDFTATVDDLIVLDDRVVTRVTYRGTHRGTWAGIPATGRQIEALGIDIFRVRGGRIVEHWHSTDHYDLVVQLGARVVTDPA